MRTLPARRVGLGANSVFTIAPPPGAVNYYADAKTQIATVVSVASRYAGAASDIGSIANAMTALVTDVGNFAHADMSAVTSSTLWAKMLSEAPSANQVTLGVYPTGAAQSLALDATTIQSLISTMPLSTADANAQATAEQNARILTARRGNVSAISPGATAPASPVTVIAQQPAAPSALSQLPWNFIIGGALVVGAVLLVTEKKGPRRNPIRRRNPVSFPVTIKFRPGEVKDIVSIGLEMSAVKYEYEKSGSRVTFFTKSSLAEFISFLKSAARGDSDLPLEDQVEAKSTLDHVYRELEEKGKR